MNLSCFSSESKAGTCGLHKWYSVGLGVILLFVTVSSIRYASFTVKLERQVEAAENEVDNNPEITPADRHQGKIAVRKEILQNIPIPLRVPKY